MARPLRIQFPGAIYHAMARGNGRQLLFHGDDDYQRMLKGLEQTVERTGWEVFSFAWMPNHIHLFFRTPQPNLSRGMQYLLSGYANWFSKRHDRPGHLFQGRFKGELVEDETYFWNVSRYIHLNPVRGVQPLVSHPCNWNWSSYPGYIYRSKQVGFVRYDQVYDAWQQGCGSEAVQAYRTFVEVGLSDPPKNPFENAHDGWLLGSEKFVQRIKKRLGSPTQPDQVPNFRRLAFKPDEIVDVVARYYGERAESYRRKRSLAHGRDIAAYLAYRHTTATLRQLAEMFGLKHPDSVSNLIRRAQRRFEASADAQGELEMLTNRIRNA